jgi:hypothetical protein
MTQYRYLPANGAELWLLTPGMPDLLLTGETSNLDGTFTIMAQDSEASWDSPQPVDVAVQRWMADGAVASTQGYENRTPTFKVIVSGYTSAGLAAGEKALARRGGAPCLLKWVPPEGAPDAPASIFEVWTWHLEHAYDGGGELRLARTYTITATAKPWARSKDLTVVVASPTVTAPTVTSIDNCSSIANGWTGYPTAITASGGAVRVSRAESLLPTDGGVKYTNRQMTRTWAVTGMGALPYLVLDITVTGGTVIGGYAVKVDSSPFLTEVAVIGTQHYYALPTGTTGWSVLNINAFSIAYYQSTTVAMVLADVSATNAIGGIGSNMQLMRSVKVGGSVPTAGSVKIASPDTTPLGTVLLYTGKDTGSGYTPTQRRNRTTGNTVTVDAAAVSGNHEALVTTGTPAGTITFVTPAAQYSEGTYAVVGRFFATSTTTLTATVTAAIGSPAEASCVGTATWGTANTWVWATLGHLQLPTRVVPPESTANLTITLAGTGAGTITFDELYLLDITHGAVSIVNTAQTRLWLDAPDANPVLNRPAVIHDITDDRSTSVGVPPASITALGSHEFDPDKSVVLAVTDGVGNALVSVSAYRRWHTHPGT